MKYLASKQIVKSGSTNANTGRRSRLFKKKKKWNYGEDFSVVTQLEVSAKTFLYINTLMKYPGCLDRSVTLSGMGNLQVTNIQGLSLQGKCGVRCPKIH